METSLSKEQPTYHQGRLHSVHSMHFFFAKNYVPYLTIISISTTCHYLPLDGILQLRNLTSLGILGTELDNFTTQQLLL